jgi:hypothetical protein
MYHAIVCLFDANRLIIIYCLSGIIGFYSWIVPTSKEEQANAVFFKYGITYVLCLFQETFHCVNKFLSKTIFCLS